MVAVERPSGRLRRDDVVFHSLLSARNYPSSAFFQLARIRNFTNESTRRRRRRIVFEILENLKSSNVTALPSYDRRERHESGPNEKKKFDESSKEQNDYDSFDDFAGL